MTTAGPMSEAAPQLPWKSSRVGEVLRWVAALAALAVLRIPYLRSDAYVLDNDEAILGLMARHWAEGSGFPLRFVGQNYGLALFETVPAAVAFKAFGDTPLVLALTVLMIFLLGLAAYGRAFRNLSGSHTWALALAVCLALFPGWIVWSLKARGLYVSGFALSGVALAALTSEREMTRHRLVLVGALLGVVALIQPFWLSITGPFLVSAKRPPWDVAFATFTAATIFAVPTVIASGGIAYWDPRTFEGFGVLRAGFLPRALARAFAGFSTPNEPGFAAWMVGGAGAAAFFMLMAVMAWEGLKSSSRVALAVAVGMLLSIVPIVVLRVRAPRYFLPSTVLTVMALAVLVRGRGWSLRGPRMAVTLAIVALLAYTAGGVGSPPTRLESPRPTATEDLRDMIAGLEADEVKGVYTPSADIQWQVLFYGNERIPTRSRSNTDRYVEYGTAVAEARRSGQRIALVADIRRLAQDFPQLDSFPGYRVGDRYLRMDQPSPLLLFMMGFELDSN